MIYLYHLHSLLMYHQSKISFLTLFLNQSKISHYSIVITTVSINVIVNKYPKIQHYLLKKKVNTLGGKYAIQ